MHFLVLLDHLLKHTWCLLILIYFFTYNIEPIWNLKRCCNFLSTTFRKLPHIPIHGKLRSTNAMTYKRSKLVHNFRLWHLNHTSYCWMFIHYEKMSVLQLGLQLSFLIAMTIQATHHMYDHTLMLFLATMSQQLIFNYYATAL